MSAPASIVWFRHDLRVEDNPALRAAVDRGGPVVPVFIWAPDEEGDWPPGAASRWWLHHSLAALAADLKLLGSRLILRTAPTQAALDDLVEATGADAVFWNRRYEPAILRRDAAVSAHLAGRNVAAVASNGSLLFEPTAIANQQGLPYKVFTPFWKACLAAKPPPEPLGAPATIPAPGRWPKSVDLNSFELLPRIDWAAGMREAWTPGERGAHDRLVQFLEEGIRDYDEERNAPAAAMGTSRLSPHLHFGEIGPRQIRQAVLERLARARGDTLDAGAEVYLREIGWREFAHHLLFHFPETPAEPLNERFRGFPWSDPERGRGRKTPSGGLKVGPAEALAAWQRGRTGFPMVDAGMRELWHTGWMHNRVRMIVASFLVKDLMISWQAGARWFWDTLVDADLANNTLGWQWTAGCGADAAPFFRVFNPVGQGEKFDPGGDYVRRWVEELRDWKGDDIHQPFDDDADALFRSGGREVGEPYPAPIVDHAMARDHALAEYRKLRR